MSAFSWLSDLFQFVGKLFPRLQIIRFTHQGVAFVHGKHPKKLDSGLHVFWPIVTELIIYPVVRQTVNLPTQCLITRDGLTVVVGGIVVIKINDIELALRDNWDIEDTIKDISLIAIRNIIVGKTLDDLCKERQSVDYDLTQELNEELKLYGVNVLKGAISDLAKCLVIKNLGNENVTYIPNDEDEE